MVEAAEGDGAVVDEAGVGGEDHVGRAGLRFDEMDAGDLDECVVKGGPLVGGALARGTMDVAGHPGIDNVVDVVKSRRAHEKGRLVGRGLGEVPARIEGGSHV
jgi:hypothetical protein